MDTYIPVKCPRSSSIQRSRTFFPPCTTIGRTYVTRQFTKCPRFFRKSDSTSRPWWASPVGKPIVGITTALLEPLTVPMRGWAWGRGWAQNSTLNAWHRRSTTPPIKWLYRLPCACAVHIYLVTELVRSITKFFSFEIRARKKESDKC